MSNIIQPNDPMVQKVLEQEQRQAEVMQFVKAVKIQFITSVYANLVVEHSKSGEPLSFERGRELAEEASKTAMESAPFLLEQMGVAQLEKQ